MLVCEFFVFGCSVESNSQTFNRIWNACCPHAMVVVRVLLLDGGDGVGDAFDTMLLFLDVVLMLMMKWLMVTVFDIDVMWFMLG
eukprot:m.46940 g.46940  ORF g.46940 m.46940 type:complete len:84 (-) comp20377_c0_seq1:37-288(-)